MSDDSIDFFDALEEYNNFEMALGGLVERMDFVEQLANNATLHESKLFLTVSSIEGLPHKKGFMKKASVKYSLQVELGVDKHKRKLFTGLTQGVLNVKDESSLVFDIVDFYAVAQMKFVLKRKNLMTGHKTVIGEHSIRLMDLLSSQNAYDEKRSKMTIKEYLASSSFVSNQLMMETTLPSEEAVTEPYTAVAVNWLETAKSSRDEAAKGLKQSILRGYQEAVVVMPKARVRLNFKFRLLPLQKCVQLSTHFKSGPFSTSSTVATSNSSSSSTISSAVHSVSDFHVFVAQAKAAEVIEVMKGLAARQVLSQALRRHSSEGLTPLDFALLAGNAEVVTVILQRAGNLCFRGMLPHRRGPFHYAVEGGSKVCVEILVRFFTKYSSREPVGLNAHASHWSPLLSELIDWRDEHSESPLLLACRLNRANVISCLLLAGADIAAVNRQTGFTPLMCASSVGASEVVTMLLSIMRTDAELEDNLHGVAIPGSSSTTDNALARHLRTNARSRNLLRGADPSAGGFFNNLALYNCDPSHKEEGHGLQAVHIAASHGHVEIVRQLLQIGVSATVTDRHGNNVFHHLAKSHTPGVRKTTVDVTPLIVIEAKQSAAYHALHSAESAASQVLLQSRPRALCVVNFRGKTALDISVESGHFEMTRMLLKGLLSAYPELSALIKSSVDAALRVLDDVARLTIAVSVSANESSQSQQQAVAKTEGGTSTRSVTEFLLSAHRANSLELVKSPQHLSNSSSFMSVTSTSVKSGVSSAATATTAGLKYAAVATSDEKEEPADDHVIEEKDDKADVDMASSASDAVKVTLIDHVKMTAGVEDLTQQLEERMKALYSALQRLYAEISDHAKRVSSTVTLLKKQGSMESVEQQLPEPYDDEADDLAYDFALSALAKKALGAETTAS